MVLGMKNVAQYDPQRVHDKKKEKQKTIYNT